ncbi:MAG: hypothetical protein NTZ94_14930, partial [Verrucomicrobia bacterium]|nr:hypothetical protein [Verrucomicrobiota bacterium]
HRYYPYGEEVGTASTGDRDKFGTYHRDQTRLDYADQRYYNSAIGRFLTSDPYEASAGAGEPRSWGRYPYVEGDPANAGDQTGLKADFEITTYAVSWQPSVLLIDPRNAVRFVQDIAYDIQSWFEKPPPGTVKAIAQSLADTVGKHDDCEALAQFAEAMAVVVGDGPYANAQFARSFGVLVPDVPLITSGITTNGSPVQLQNGSASGYRSSYQDDGDKNSDQGHHFAAFFQAGFWNGALAAGALSASWERLQTVLGQGGGPNDTALGVAAGSLGARVRSGEIKRDALGKAIRDEICAH